MTEKMTTGEALAELRAVGYNARYWSKGGLHTIYLGDGTEIWAGRWDLLVRCEDVQLAVWRAVTGHRCEGCSRPANAELCVFCEGRERQKNRELAMADVAAMPGWPN